jgi:hypothetical protein
MLFDSNAAVCRLAARVCMLWSGVSGAWWTQTTCATANSTSGTRPCRCVCMEVLIQEGWKGVKECLLELELQVSGSSLQICLKAGTCWK